MGFFFPLRGHLAPFLGNIALQRFFMNYPKRTVPEVIIESPQGEAPLQKKIRNMGK